MKIKEGLVGLIAGMTFAFNSFAAELPKGYEYFDKENYYRFNEVTAAKIAKGNNVGWYIYDTEEQNTIGDEKNEREKYKKYALMATSKDVINSSSAGDLKEIAKEYRNLLLAYELVYNLPNLVLEQLSQIEGKLLRAYATGGKDLAAKEQKKLVKKIIDEQKKEIAKRVKEKILGDEEEIDVFAVGERLKKYVLESVEFKILEAADKLDDAAFLIELEDEEDVAKLKYEGYKRFLDDFIDGLTTGKVYADAIDNIRKNVNPKALSQKIAKNLAKGAYVDDYVVKFSKLIDFPIDKVVFGDKDFMDVFNNLGQEYIKERNRFKHIEGKYNLSDGSVSLMVLNDLMKMEKKPKKPNYNLNKIKKNICDELKKEDIDALNYFGGVECSFETLDLNNDKIPEIKAWVPEYCGGGGCNEKIYGIRGENIFLIIRNFGGMEILNSKTNGYKDIIKGNFDYNYPSKCRENEGITWKAAISTLFKWDGNSYVENKIVKIDSYEEPCETKKESCA